MTSSKAKKYNQGAALERECRQVLYRMGAQLVMKAGGSKVVYPQWWKGLKPKVDLIAIMEDGSTILVQCKKKGVIGKEELTELQKFSSEVGIEAFVARRNSGDIEWAPVETLEWEIW